MHVRLRHLLAGPALAIALVACGGAAAPTTTPAAAATAPAGTATAFPIRTAAQQPQACMDALLGGKLTKSVASGLSVTSSDGKSTPVEWPFRYSALQVAGQVQLLDEAGKIVASEGDEITVGGGFGNNVWFACAPVTVTKAASAPFLRTQPAPLSACDAALLAGGLERHPGTGLGIQNADGIIGVEWPFGYSARVDGASIVLLDGAGNLVAREHDRVEIGGGLGTAADGAPLWKGCGIVHMVPSTGG